MKEKATTRLFTWIIALSLVAFTVFNAVNYYLLSASYYERISENNQIHTETVAFGVSAFFETVYRVVGEMSQSQDIKNMNEPEQKKFIDDRFSQYGFFNNIVVQPTSDNSQPVKVKGDVLSQSNQWWFQKIIQEKRPFVSPSFYSFTFDINVPTTVNGVFFPVTKGEKMVAVLATFLHVGELQERVGHYYRGDDRYTYILDEEGKVIVHPEGETIKGQFNYRTAIKTGVSRNVNGEPIISGQDYQLEYRRIHVPEGLRQAANQALNGFTGATEYTDSEGNVIICSYAPVRMPGYSASWAAITIQNKNKAMAPLWEAAVANGILSFFIFTGLAVLLLRQSRAVDKSANKLAETNTELLATNDELTAMTEQLQHTNDQVVREIGVRQIIEEQLRLRECQYRAMVRLLTDNTAELDVQMQTMLESALQLTGAMDGYISLSEKEDLTVKYVKGIHANLLGQQLSPLEGLFPVIFETGRLSYVEDFQSLPGRRMGDGWDNLSTVIMVPLKDEKKVVGSMVLTWTNVIHQMAAEELELLQQYADLASLAFQGARYKDNLRQQMLQKELLHNKISHIAFHDALTGLPNRASLMAKLEKELSDKVQGPMAGAVLFIDLDDLKSINDNFGHSVGDQVIITAGKKIVEVVGENIFVARLGGDEFIILLQEYNAASIVRMADKLANHMCQDYPIGGTSIRLTASIGIAMYPQDGNTVEELMKKADNAMYAAKADGRNCWRFFDPMMLHDAQEKLILTNSLRKAMERRELFIVYQPQVNLADGRIAGFEALLRWHSPLHGNISPSRFIPLAEENRLIGDIGKWVLEESCNFIKRLTHLGYPTLQVAVNLSPKQLSDENLVDVIDQIVLSSGINPHQLELEITESSFLSSLEESVSKLQKLDKLGIKLALDDFGTGYSSLTHLRLFPVGKLKIDKSFIDTIPEGETQLVKSLIHFAQEMNMIVVAEGVEEQKQLDYLTLCNCNLIQGYFMSRPLLEEEALQFLYERNGGSC